MPVSYEQWHNRVEATLDWRSKHWNGSSAWQRYYALYRGDHWRSSVENPQGGMIDMDSENPPDRIVVNKTMSTILTVKPFLMKRNPKFILHPRRMDKPEDIVSAFIQQEILNYEWRERKMQRQAKNALLDVLIAGHGILKNGYTKTAPTAAKKKDGEIEYRQHISDEALYLERVNPMNFIFDVDTGNNDLASARWAGHIFFRSKEDIIADTRYNAVTRGQIESGFEQVETITPDVYKKYEEHEDLKRCILYEIWDVKYKKYYVFAKGIEKPLIEEDWPYPYLEGLPFDKLDYISIPNEAYGGGIPYQIEHQQLEKNRVRTTMFEHRRRFNRKFLAIKELIDQEEKEKFENGEDGTTVWAMAPNAILPVPDASLTTDTWRLDEIIDRDFNDIAGIDALIRNADLPSRTSAAEINARQNYSSLKLDDRVADVDEWIMNCGRKLLQHIKENYNSERAVKVVGPLGEFWINYSPADIRAEVDFDMDTVSAPRIDPTIEKQQAIELMQVVGNNLQVLTQMQILPPEQIKKIYEYSLRKIMGENKELGSFGLGNIQPGSTVNAQQLTAGVQGGLSSGAGGGLNGGSLPS